MPHSRWRSGCWRSRSAATSGGCVAVRRRGGARRHARARVPAGAWNILASLLVWFALRAPNRAYGLTPASFLRIPVEGLVIAGLALVLPSAPRRAMGVLVGVALGVLTIVKLLDVGFF